MNIEEYRRKIKDLSSVKKEIEGDIRSERRASDLERVASMAGSFMVHESLSGPPYYHAECQKRARIRNNVVGVEDLRGPQGLYNYP